MPEGDTIFRAAARMATVLDGRTVTKFESARLIGRRPAVGELIERVEAVGKHLLVHFGSGLTLRTHMRMNGSWHLYRVGERWRKPGHLARVVIETGEGWVAVCFSAPVIETFDRRGPLPDALARLGPDLSGESPDLDAVVARCRSLPPETEIANALLDQSVGAGIGNVYKSDVLFIHGVNPWTPVGQLTDGALEDLYTTAHRLLRSNLVESNRVTFAGGLAVYGKGRRPCPKCQTLINGKRQGELARLTYWCPACQPVESMLLE